MIAARSLFPAYFPGQAPERVNRARAFPSPGFVVRVFLWASPKQADKREPTTADRLARSGTSLHNKTMLWIKAFHIVFVASWFAGLFYLPRLFVNLATVPPDSHAERERLLMMARKLYRFSSLLMIPALVLGFVLWLYYGVGRGPGNYWMHAKLLLVVLAIGYHHACRSLLRKFEQFANVRSERWFRVFNESAVLLFVAIVVLVIVKPF